MSQKLETLDFVIKVLLEHERELDKIADRFQRLTDKLNWWTVWLEMLLGESPA